MDIHHSMIVRKSPKQVYDALTQQDDLAVWMDAPAVAQAQVGSIIEFHYPQRSLKMEILQLEEQKQVKWRVIQALWRDGSVPQIITWRLVPYEDSTMVDFRMEGWPQDDDTYASLSYKWASFMMRLKIYLGDTREIASLLPISDTR